MISPNLVTEFLQAIEKNDGNSARLLNIIHEAMSQPEPSQVLKSIFSDLKSREEAGKSKYGTTVDRTDYDPEKWFGEGYEEALDLVVYMAAGKQALARLRERKNNYQADQDPQLIVKHLLADGFEITHITCRIADKDNPINVDVKLEV